MHLLSMSLFDIARQTGEIRRDERCLHKFITYTVVVVVFF